jgi:hypothetical protein
MRTSVVAVLASALLASVAGCASGSGGPAADAPSAVTVTSSGAATILDVANNDPEPFSGLAPGLYAVDPDLDPSTPMLVTFRLSHEGWKSWIGAAKFSRAGHVGVSITTVTTVVTDGCRDHTWAFPHVGPSVDDLATALANLRPFHLTRPPEEVTAFGFPGQHLTWTVPNLPMSKDGHFTRCAEGKLKSWVAAIDVEPGDAFYGYTGPGYQEEFWLLDVEGTRLMIATERSLGSPPRDVRELRGIVDSIQIET